MSLQVMSQASGLDQPSYKSSEADQPSAPKSKLSSLRSLASSVSGRLHLPSMPSLPHLPNLPSLKYKVAAASGAAKQMIFGQGNNSSDNSKHPSAQEKLQKDAKDSEVLSQEGSDDYVCTKRRTKSFNSEDTVDAEAFSASAAFQGCVLIQRSRSSSQAESPADSTPAAAPSASLSSKVLSKFKRAPHAKKD